MERSLRIYQITMEYPRKVTLESDKLQKLLIEKAELITIGRAKSEEIEKVEVEMEVANKELIEAEGKVDISDLDEKAKVISEKVNEAIKEMNGVKQEIYDRMKAQVPIELGTKYEELKKTKEVIENERNKIALKAQKYNDKIIPLGRKLMKPFIESDYEDYETIQLENGQVVATIFNHLEEFKAKFLNKK